MRLCIVLSAALSIFGLLNAQAPQKDKIQPKPFAEEWEAIQLENSQVGHYHAEYFQAKDSEGKPIIQSKELVEMTFNRFGQVLKVQLSISTEETPDGKVRSFATRMPLANQQTLDRKATIKDGMMSMNKQITGTPTKTINEKWNDKAIGLYAQKNFFIGQKLEPEMKLKMWRFEPELDTVIGSDVKVLREEETTLLTGAKAKLWKVEIRLPPLGDKGEFSLPPLYCWVDGKGTVQKRMQTMPGIGDIYFYRTDRQQALTRTASSNTKDIGNSQLIKVNRSLSQFNTTKEVRYKVTLKDVENPEKAFISDDVQKVVKVTKNGSESVLEIVVTGRTQPPSAEVWQDPPFEYLKSNHFIRSNDRKVQDLARQAIGSAVTPWEKAKRIEKWVHSNMKSVNFTEAFATADEVARTLSGDCTEHAVLVAAMCRAVGVASRTPIGLVHVASKQAMGFHMWSEVWVNGKWYPIDGTLGDGMVGACHLKVVTVDWNNTESLTPLLPVMQIVGKMKIDMQHVEFDPYAGIAK